MCALDDEHELGFASGRARVLRVPVVAGNMEGGGPEFIGNLKSRIYCGDRLVHVD